MTPSASSLPEQPPTGRSRLRSPDEGPRATLRQLIPFLLEHRGVLILVAVLSIVGAATTLTQPLLVGQIIERVQSEDTLGTLGWGVVALVVASSLISGYQHYLLQRTSTAVVFSSRRKLIARILNLPISEFDQRRTGDLVSRVGTDTTLLYAVLTDGFADAVGSALIFAGAVIGMAVIDPILLVTIVAVLGGSVVGVTTLSGRIRRATTLQQQQVGELASGVERAVSSIRTVRAAGATKREITALTTLAAAVYRVGVRIAKVSALIVPVAGIALQVSLLVVLGLGGYRVASGAIGIAELVTFVMFLFLLIGPLDTLFGAITSVNQALGALGRIQEVLDLPGESDRDAHTAVAADRPGPQASTDNAVAFIDVHFSYPAAVTKARQSAQSEALSVLERARVDTSSVALPGPDSEPREVLRGVSFAVPRGARVALVGPSGAGKSTTLALMERFYDPTAGAILIAGKDARTLSREALRSQLGYVEQDAPTLAGSIADNLRLTSPEASDNDCRAVLEAVNLGDVVRRDPRGIDAAVGEGGVMLSGGERQRLAIARTLLAAPPILLLDESTSSLDGVNEQRMREAVETVAEGRTLIVIAHRLSTVVDSDLIVVLDRGQVVGQGTHEELVQTTPLYRELARHQLLA